MDDKKNSKDPLADLPYWLQDFKENLKGTKDTEVTKFSGCLPFGRCWHVTCGHALAFTAVADLPLKGASVPQRTVEIQP